VRLHLLPGTLPIQEVGQDVGCTPLPTALDSRKLTMDVSVSHRRRRGVKTTSGEPERRLGEFAALVRERARQRGRKAPLAPDEIQALATRMALLDLAAEEMGLYRARSEKAEGGLTAPEEKLLAERGARPGALPPGTPDPIALHLAGMARLRADSMSVEEAARLLGVDPSRIRQRLGGRPRTLLGMKVGAPGASSATSSRAIGWSPAWSSRSRGCPETTRQWASTPGSRVRTPTWRWTGSR
jgi:hypothetical protein